MYTAPNVLADADDTAKTILCLHLLGRDAECDQMIEAFEEEGHFKTYDLESNESLSANCNVLLAILSSKSPNSYLPQISKALAFVCRKWYEGSWTDKWVTDSHIHANIQFIRKLITISPESRTPVLHDASCPSTGRSCEVLGLKS